MNKTITDILEKHGICINTENNKLKYPMLITGNNLNAAINEILDSRWIDVNERPLFTTDEKGNWTCTKDGDQEFIAAVQYSDKRRPDENNLWWIRHCVVEDGIGLCVVGDDSNDPAGWDLEQVSFWMPLHSPPKTTPNA